MLKPYGPHILIEVLPVEVGALSITGEESEKPIRGKILAIGEVSRPELIKVGDIIIYDYYSAVEYHQTDKEFLIINEDDILAIEEE